MAIWFYKCNARSSSYQSLSGDWEDLFSSGRPQSWGSTRYVPQLAAAKRGDLIFAYQTDRNELVGLAVVKHVREHGKSSELIIEPVQRIGARLRELKKNNEKVSAIPALQQGIIRTLYSVTYRDAWALLRAVGAPRKVLLKHKPTLSEERNDPTVVRRVFDSIFLDAAPRVRSQWLTYLTDVIRNVDQQYADRWAVAMFPEKQRVRIYVGMMLVLSLDPGGVWMPLRHRVNLPGARYSRIRYRSVPKCVGLNGSVVALAPNLERLQGEHLAAIGLAAAYSSVAHIQNSHSPGVIEYLESARKNRPLPQPATRQDPEGRNLFPDEIDMDADLVEGARVATRVNRYERSRQARLACIKHHGTRCSVCGMSFAERYGKSMEGFIHVHHMTPISTRRRRYSVDPIKDLSPVCLNCHAVIHYRNGRVPMSLQDARRMLRRSGGRA